MPAIVSAAEDSFLPNLRQLDFIALLLGIINMPLYIIVVNFHTGFLVHNHTCGFVQVIGSAENSNEDHNGNDLLVRTIYMFMLILTAIYTRAIHVLRDLSLEITNRLSLIATCQAPVLCKFTNAASAHGEEVH